MNGGDFLDTLKGFASFLGEILTAAFWGLYMIFSSAYTRLSSFLESINIPILPSKSKILQEHFVSGGFAVIIIIYIICINVSAFRLFKLDKIKAKQAPPKDNLPKRSRKYDRISERKLMSRCFWGGALGGFIGMKVYHHKTLKPKFTIGVMVMLIVQLLIFSFVMGFFGFWLYLS